MILIILQLLLAFALAVFVIHFFGDVVLRRAPYVPVREAVLKDIVDALDLTPESVLYDIGCGDGRVLRAAARAYPGIRCIGIESNWFVSMLARWKTRHVPIEIRRIDAFKADISAATHIYAFVTPSMLERLEPMVLAQCKSGTRIVLCDFPFPTLTPTKTLALPARKGQLNSVLFIYER